jgi:hypothetical protein
MGSHKRLNWVLTQSQDFEPGKTLAPGQILEDAFQPASALIPRGQVPPPPELVRDKITKQDVALQLGDNFSASFKQFCETNGLPLSASVAASHSNRSEARWELDSLVSETFVPDMAYVKIALRSGDVPTKTQWWKLRRRIYMVTGIRTAIGASKSSTDDTSTSLEAVAKFDGTHDNVPVTAGTEAHLDSGSHKAEDTKGISDFVFAYRLSEITYRLWTSHKPITTGHTASRGQHEETDDGHLKVSDEDTILEEEGYELVGLDDDPFEGEDASIIIVS